MKRKKKCFLEFKCEECGHRWSTSYGTLMFLIAFKKDKFGLVEKEIFVRAIYYT